MNNTSFGIQLFTLRDYCKTIEDIENTLKNLYNFGVRDVQISAIGDVDWSDLAVILKKYNMNVCVTHTSFERMKNDIDAVIDDHIKIGCDCIGVGAMPSEYEKTAEGADAFIRDLIPVAERIHERGLHFAYHNHDFDLKIYGNKSIIDRMIELDSDKVWFIPDVAWIQYAGENPTEYIQKLKGRVKVLHFKDFITDNEGKIKFTELGKGNVDFNKLIKTVKELEIPHVVFEQDADWTINPMESCKESFSYMNSLQ